MWNINFWNIGETVLKIVQAVYKLVLVKLRKCKKVAITFPKTFIFCNNFVVNCGKVSKSLALIEKSNQLQNVMRNIKFIIFFVSRWHVHVHLVKVDISTTLLFGVLWKVMVCDETWRAALICYHRHCWNWVYQKLGQTIKKNFVTLPGIFRMPNCKELCNFFLNKVIQRNNLRRFCQKVTMQFKIMSISEFEYLNVSRFKKP